MNRTELDFVADADRPRKVDELLPGHRHPQSARDAITRGNVAALDNI